jgi:soluble lytic murein transglycosylase
VAEFQRGRVGPLIAQFGAESALASPIGDHAGGLLADALARRGDLAAARAAAVGVADRRPASRLAPGALIQAATLAARAGDEVGAQALLRRLLTAYPDSPEIPQALYLLGMSAEARSQLDAAVHAYRELTVLAPATGWADGAADRLAALAMAGVRTPGLSDKQRVERAERLLKGGVPRIAHDEAERIAQEAQDPGVAARALRVIADAAQRMGRHELAARALDLAAARAPADRQPGLRLEQARLLLRAGKRQEALAVLAGLERTPTEAEAAEAAFLRGRTLDDLDRRADAAAAYRAVAARYPNREVAGAALWRLGWLAYLRQDLRAAEQAWTKATEVAGGRGWRHAALYWAGRAAEQTSGRGKAEVLYQRLLTEAPRSYYGLLAARRVAGPGAGTRDEPSIRLPADPRDGVENDPGFARAELLRRIGLVEFAALELEDVVLGSVGDPVRLYGFTSAYMREERYHLGLRILRRHFASLAATGHPTIPRAFWEMLYPFGWRGEVTEAASRAGIDPFLVAAVVREESNYHPRAVSRVGARGLMQLMPATAQPMADVRGWPFNGGDLLDEPGANIQLGTAFLAGLLREFGDPRLAVAAYNAGPRRVRDWLKARRPGDLEAFVEQIPFDETRQYVKRVMLSWDEYRRIYGEP